MLSISSWRVLFHAFVCTFFINYFNINVNVNVNSGWGNSSNGNVDLAILVVIINPDFSCFDCSTYWAWNHLFLKIQEQKRLETIRMKVKMRYILMDSSITKYFEFSLTNEAVMLLFSFFQKVLLSTVKIQNIEHDHKSWTKRILWQWCTHQCIPECLWMMIRNFNSVQ